MPQCEEAIERVIMGPERKSRVISEKEKKTIAYHETGHAVAGYVTPGADPVRKITILPRGMALGVTWSMPEDDKHLQTTEELFAQIVVLLGGRVAEEIVFGDVTTGASNDLERATDLARKMVMKYGMSEKVGLITYGKDDDNVFLGRDIMKRHYCSEKTSETIDAEVKRIVDEAYAQTKKTLLSYTERMDFVVERLLDCEVMEGDELKEIMEAENLDDLREKYKIEEDRKKEAKKEEDNAEESSDDELEDDEDINEYPEDPFSFLVRKVRLADREKKKDENDKKEDEW
ncbi:cell division protein FtsH, partial [bacterium]|nr:cell division protein FtsH [bacterium]